MRDGNESEETGEVEAKTQSQISKSGRGRVIVVACNGPVANPRYCNNQDYEPQQLTPVTNVVEKAMSTAGPRLCSEVRRSGPVLAVCGGWSRF
ncbi:hypothetical protein QR685DRAFT_502998 [Neurospora intermedia]|uniref:Uncharacterized protein n=1 Tax=Neurospora intermedia TaxID=5142 RepID=A0ABR3D5C8_NEUIN